MGEAAPVRDDPVHGPGGNAGARTARLYERHARALYGLCLMLLRDPHDAEDALQSAFLAAHGALVRGGEPRDEGAWLATIVRNECRGRIRRRMETPVHEDAQTLETVPDPQPAPSERMTDPEVQRALAALSDKQREAVVLHDVLGLRSREVGVAIGASLPAVEALVFRARRQLRVRLRPVGILVVPAALGETLAQAIPGFVAPAAAAGLAGGTGGAVGAGLLAKLGATPTAAKVAAGVAAVATGSVAAVETTNEPPPRAPASPALSVPAETTDDRDGHSGDDASGPGSGASEDRDDHEGHGSGDEADDRDEDDRTANEGHGSMDDVGADDDDANEGRSSASNDDERDAETDDGEEVSGSGRSGQSGRSDDSEVADDDSSGPGSGQSSDDAG